MTNKNLTKKQKYDLKKKQKQKERQKKQRRKKIKRGLRIALPVIIIVGLVVWGLVGYLSQEKSQEHPGRPKIEIPVSEYDAGTVSMANGLVKHSYEIKNTGVGDLEIDRIWTSCSTDNGEWF